VFLGTSVEPDLVTAGPDLLPGLKRPVGKGGRTRCRQCRSCSATCLPTRLTAMDREDSIRRQLCRFGLQEAQEGPGIRLGPGSRHRGIRRHPASAAIFWGHAGRGFRRPPQICGQGRAAKGHGMEGPPPRVAEKEEQAFEASVSI
jgi:hypothetical protein